MFGIVVLRFIFWKEWFRKCSYEHMFFLKIKYSEKMLIVLLYVGDLIFTRNNSSMFEKFEESMMVKFDMFDLSLMHYFLGISQDKGS